MKIVGSGVFAGYYGRSDLTGDVLIDVSGELCYATGDFGRFDVRLGQLIFVGRRDHQIKLRGQRIELGHIEQTLMEISSLISGCIVVKNTFHEEEHLVAYVEASLDKVKVDELRAQCRSRLPSYMVPSKFILLEQFPLSINGKIDRKSLPPPDFTTTDISSIDSIEHVCAMTEMEKQVHDLWCEVLHMDYISVTTSFFALHGTSLLFMKLYNRYQTSFAISPNIVACLQHASIAEHAELLSNAIISSSGIQYKVWTSLQINHGINYIH